MADRCSRPLAVLLVATLGVGVAFAAFGQGQSLGRQLAEARLKALADGDLPGAVPLYQALVAQASGSVRAESAAELGEALETLGRQAEALEVYQSALAVDPRNARSAANLARLGGLGQQDMVVPSSETGPTANPVLPPGAMGWEALLPPAERAAFVGQVERFARNKAARSLFANGRRLWARQETDRALAVFEQVVTQFSADLSTAELVEIGEIEMGKGQAIQAARAFRAAAERDPPAGAPSLKAQAMFRAGEALMQVGDMAEARASFRALMALGPAAKGTGGRGLALPAEIHFREIRELRSWEDFQTVQGLFRQGQEAQYGGHDPAAAETLYRRIVTEFPRSNFDGRALIQLASIAWFEHQDAKAALESLDLVLDGDRKNDLWPDGMRAGPWALFHQGRVREGSGDRPGAKTAYRQVVDQYPDARDHDGKAFAPRALQRLAILGGLP